MHEDMIPAFDEALGSETYGPAGHELKGQKSHFTPWVLT